MNPNDISAKTYDLVSRPFKGIEVTSPELELIKTLTFDSSKILDVGAGTGRHAIELAKEGYQMTCIDSSSGMLEILKEKARNMNLNIKIIPQSIYDYSTSVKYDLIILMWNAFNEIALTENDAELLLQKLKSLLNTGGKILINIDNADEVDPSSFDFHTTHIHERKSYEVNWKTQEYLKETNTAISLEKVKVLAEGKLISETETLIKQRYWYLEEINHLAIKSGLNLHLNELAMNEELYIVLT